MSAWLCEDEFLKQIACAGLVGKDDYHRPAYVMGKRGQELDDARLYPDEFASEVAILLRAENYRSLAARYQSRAESYFGDAAKAPPIRVTLGDLDRARLIPIGYAVKMLDCYEYQACEARDWFETLAYKVANELRRNLSRRTDHYEAAPWGDCFPFSQPAPELVSLYALARKTRTPR